MNFYKLYINSCVTSWWPLVCTGQDDRRDSFQGSTTINLDIRSKKWLTA